MSNEAMAIALHHSRSSGTTKLVLLGIANHDGDGGAWPSLATLATYAGGVSERTVSRAIGELVELGEISVERNAGGLRNCRDDRRPNLYHFLLSCPPECDGSKNHRVRRHGVTPVSTRRTDVPVDNFSDTWPEDSDGVTLVTERVDTGDIYGVTPVSTEPVHKNQSIKRECSPNSPADEKPVDNFPETDSSFLTVAHPGDERDRASTNFDLFWSAYPRKVGKQKARAKFTAALKRASAETIIAGVQRLALDLNLPEKQFIPHPTTWLERDGWEDEPLPARGRQTRSQQAWEADMRGFLAEEAEEQAARFQIGGAL